MLLSFEEKTRRIWMFPRNIRNIEPWKLNQILKVLMYCDDLDHFSTDDQKQIYRLFEEVGIKSKAFTRDNNPGGTRTYYAQLEALGLIYRSPDKNYQYTLAGQAIAEGTNPLNALQYQLFRHQYPSAYGGGMNVLIDGRMKVKPFQFLLKLFRDDRMEGYLSDYDVMIPVIYGHNHGCFEICVEKILRYRKTGNILDVVDNPDLDLFTPRGTPGKVLNNVHDIANTATNYLRAANLIIQSPLHKNPKRFEFNLMFEALYDDLSGEFDSFIEYSRSNNESFQRAYGRYLNQKDTRKSSRESRQSKDYSDVFIQVKYVDFINDNLFMGDDVAEFANYVGRYGFTSDQAVRAVRLMQKSKSTLEENLYLAYASSGGKNSEEFERATTNLLLDLGFKESLWIGRRISKINWRGNFPDVFIKREESMDCGFADTKATMLFALGHIDMLKMKETYLYSNEEIYPGTNLKYFVYIAGGFKGDIKHSTLQLQNETKVKVTAIEARLMLKLLKLKEKGWTAQELEERFFCKGGLITEEDFLFLL
ncbi:MAG: hypothetical protein M0Q37_07035 [Sphaerochaeta sp.]|nr:hypothetical protein [Sphaerochaeta sp.]